ncbi:MAG: GH32 C-terminal domain-containing protein [Oscillospiraceae bacterium]|nr:GH32 C-terminal domain-containing protein [Oscillospiraceae bacterium]
MNKKLALRVIALCMALCMALSMLVSCASPANQGGGSTSASIPGTHLKVNNKKFHTNLTGLSTESGTWEVTNDGLHGNAVEMGDCFVYSETSAENFVYSADVKFLVDEGAASLVFNATADYSECYVVNLDAGSKMVKYWRWSNLGDEQLIDMKEVPATSDDVYNLKVVVIGGWVSYYVNDTLVASSGDYTLQPGNKGQDTYLKGGYLGLLNWNGDMVFQNVVVTPIEGAFDPTLTNLSVSSSAGTVEKAAQFSSGEPIFLQYVKNDASTVDINADSLSDQAEITVIGPDGKTYEGGKNVPVDVGVNYIPVISTVTAEDGTTASLTYRVNVHRRQPDDVYYNEPYRDQYHYSVKDGWANDPNGLVYYKGTYHFFYQFYDARRWGPMHWAHATSTDLVHWEDQPIAFYPDTNGAMFSGCIVADETNASGLFSTSEGGLIAFITADGNGQRIKLAYSEDEGVTWTKLDQIIADWTRDPLGVRDFRDPKVFRWEGKWFMVLAGGPLRIYSSENLVDWTCESTYADLHTECPDMYPIQADDGQIKWVLSRGGRLYKIGDFHEVDGHWCFEPDAEYADNDGVMNFGKDSYAAMTFYVQDFGTAENPTLPDIIEINWMNTWDNYCNDVADKVGQEFNGTFNLALKAGLIKEGDTYLLTQTPIENYQTLRGEAIVDLKGETIGAENTVLDDFKGDCYEIESTFYPAEGTTKVGFQLRVGGEKHTDVIYDLTTETISLDRSKSGTLISGMFLLVNSQNVTRNADGSVTLHIYVDKASVEVFTKDDTVAGADQIFPELDSLGAKVIVEGDAAQADITIYPMNSIW